MKVAFDCDGTLVNYDGTLREDVIRVMLGFADAGMIVTVWSGGGKSYAESILNRILHIYAEDESDFNILSSQIDVQAKNHDLKPDLAFDDQYVNLGSTNVTIPPKSRRPL
jgi:FMN phosphatase YigB (HAD superfamily)